MSDTPSTSFLPLTGHAKDLGGGFTVRRLLPAFALLLPLLALLSAAWLLWQRCCRQWWPC